MLIISKESLKGIRERYVKGTLVELVSMNDIQAPPEGTRGTVMCVDDMGTIHVAWETGSSLGVVFGEDACKIVD